MKKIGLIEKYNKYLELPEYTKPITLYEGNTPLIPVPRLANDLGGGFDLFIKVEGLNPTGSFKDRGMTAAVSEAVGRGAQTVICASTGNTAASAAAYAARAGVKAIVLIPEGNVALGKLAGALAYGAQVVQIDGSFDDALDLVIKVSEKHAIALVNSINPYRIEGQKTGAYEICDELGGAPDIHCLPVGNAGNISAYWAGYKTYDEEKGTGLPQLLGVQAAGAAPLVIGETVKNPDTIATAIRIGRPARGEQALLSAEESGGKIIAVSDEQILAMQDRLAREGIWVEPASAAGVAGLKQEIIAGTMDISGKRVVVVCTGHGMKDPGIITDKIGSIDILPVDINRIEKIILE